MCVDIKQHQKAYDEMMKKINKIKFDDDNTKSIKTVGYKLNYFIETSINEMYKLN